MAVDAAAARAVAADEAASGLPSNAAAGDDAASLDPMRPDGRRRGVFDAYIIVDI
jgi:hypothetical protein